MGWSARAGGGQRRASPGAAGLDRRAGTTVRLLSERNDDQGGRASRADAGANAAANQERVHDRRFAASLPLRQLRGDSRRGTARLDADRQAEGNPAMTATLSRRQFVKTGGVLFVGFGLVGR